MGFLSAQKEIIIKSMEGGTYKENEKIIRLLYIFDIKPKKHTRNQKGNCHRLLENVIGQNIISNTKISERYFYICNFL